MLTLEEWRFWSKVDIREDNECWPWQGAKLENGYGFARLHGRNQVASRIAYQLFNKIKLINRKQFVCHTCNNGHLGCVNPHHLILGNSKSNTIGCPGSRNSQAKLNEKQIKQIRKLYKQGVSNKLLAQKFHVSKGHINDIVAKRYWKDFDQQVTKLVA